MEYSQCINRAHKNIKTSFPKIQRIKIDALKCYNKCYNDIKKKTPNK